MLKSFVCSCTRRKILFDQGSIAVHHILRRFLGATVESQLALFPEFKEAKAYESVGKFTKAYPSYERIFDSLQFSIGVDSPLTGSLVYRMSNLHRYNGDYQKAIHLLSTHLPKIQKNVHEKIRLQQLLSINYLLSEQKQKALEIAQESVQLSEQVASSQNHPNENLLSSSYGLYGICSLINEDLSEAEGFLQMSCRWAFTPAEQLISAANNGVLLWYRLANDSNPDRFHYWNVQKEKIFSNTAFIASQHNGNLDPLKRIERDSAVYKEQVVHTLNGWLEATEEAQKGQFQTGTIGCGPMSMTGMQEKDVAILSTPAIENPAKSDTNPMALEEKLAKDPKFALAYANLLYNISEIYEFTGKYAESSEYLSSAMKAINPHSNQPTTSLLVAPLLGKILRQIGYYHMCNSQAVSAEGLYRAALEKLASPNSAHDTRYQLDAAVTKGYYGKLLKKWDKREALGEKYIEEYQTFINQKYPDLSFPNKPFYPLVSMIQFPIDFF